MYSNLFLSTVIVNTCVKTDKMVRNKTGCMQYTFILSFHDNTELITSYFWIIKGLLILILTYIW